MHFIGSERKYKPGALITIDLVPYRVLKCIPTRHQGWWKLEVEQASTSTDRETPDGLNREALEHSKDYSKNKFSGPDAAYYWSLANLGLDLTIVATMEDDGISVISFTPTEDEKEYFGLPKDDDEIFLIEDDQGFVETRDRWTGYRPEEDFDEEEED